MWRSVRGSPSGGEGARVCVEPSLPEVVTGLTEGCRCGKTSVSPRAGVGGNACMCGTPDFCGCKTMAGGWMWIWISVQYSRRGRGRSACTGRTSPYRGYTPRGAGGEEKRSWLPPRGARGLMYVWNPPSPEL